MRKVSQPRNAFSLLELLVVLAVMGIMMGLIGFTFLAKDTSNLESAQLTAFTLLQKTRALALSNSAEARLLVVAEKSDSDGVHSDKYLRFVQIVVEDKNNTGNWNLVDEGVFLPEMVWMVGDNIESDTDGWPIDGNCIWSSSDEDDDFRLVLEYTQDGNSLKESSDGEKFFFIACQATGVFLSHQYPTMPRLVMAKGNLIPVSSEEMQISLLNRGEVLGIQTQPFGGIFLLESSDFTYE